MYMVLHTQEESTGLKPGGDAEKHVIATHIEASLRGK